jgi:iron complex transport system substrate-binding protein
MKRLLLILLVICSATLQPSGSGPDANGTPQRIVCLIPNVTQMLFAIGAGQQIVGVSSFAHDPPEADRLPKVGGLLDPDTERILALRPDFAIVYAGQQELQQRLARAGIRLWIYKHGDLGDVMRTIRDVGGVVGHRAEAEQVASRIERELNVIAARVAGRPRPKTMLVFGREPHALRNVFASGGYGFLHDMLVTAGGADVFEDIKRESVQASTEQILARAPDVIVELHYGSAATDVHDLTPWQRLSSVPAVKNRRIYELTGDEFVEGGVRIGDATRRLAQLLHPEAFR